MTKKRVALVLSLFALGLAGCGGDDEEDDDFGTVPTVPLSVPGGSTTAEDGEVTTGTTVETVPDGGTPAPAPTPTPAPAPPAQTPDSPDNDTPPPAGSEAEQFENFCSDNPGAC
jgi:hypothetical protein